MSSGLRMKILIGVALAIGVYVFLVPADPSTAEPSRGERELAASGARHGGGSHRDPPSPAVHSLQLLAHRVSDGAAAAALFAAHSWYTPPPPPPAPPAPVLSAEQVAALQKPKAPPLPFAFMGSYTTGGATPVFFLTQGDRVYSVRVGDVLDNTYSVDALSNGQLLMTYKPLKIQQQLPVGGAP